MIPHSVRIGASYLLGVLVMVLFSSTAAWADGLSRVEARVAARHATAEISAAALAGEMQRVPAGWTLFDVREEEEFARSHLPGAIHVDPDTSAADFLDMYGAVLQSDGVVFYCSVGERSSVMIERLQSALGDDPNAAAAMRWRNLRGGIFRWYGDGYPVVDNEGQPTEALHSYRLLWKLLIPRRRSSGWGPESASERPK